MLTTEQDVSGRRATPDSGDGLWSRFQQSLQAFRSPRQIVNAVLDWQCPFDDEPLPEGLDRWTLNSNLHKAVRHGHLRAAVVTARALYAIDPAYCLRRLPVIAMEEVSIGALEVVLDVLHLCREVELQHDVSGSRRVGYLAARMASATQCAAARDLMACLESEQGDVLWERVKHMDPRRAMYDARDAAASCSVRSMAFLRLDLLSLRRRDARRRMLQVAGDCSGLPPLLMDVLVAGHSTYGFNAMLPMVFDLLRRSPIELQRGGERSRSPTLGPLLLSCSLDGRTRIGRAAVKRWVASIDELRDMLVRLRGPSRASGSVLPLVHAALGCVEDGRDQHQLTSAALEVLRREAMIQRFARWDVAPPEADELCSRVRRHLDVLDAIRAQQLSVGVALVAERELEF